VAIDLMSSRRRGAEMDALSYSIGEAGCERLHQSEYVVRRKSSGVCLRGH